jgi:protein-S-isoprenylcysteine O-methyltransferase Ste14
MLKTVSLFGFLGMVAGLIGLVATRSLFFLSPFVIVPQAAAVALMIWARVTFGRRSFHATANPTKGGLVTTGPYQFIRHPIYTAVCLFVLAGGAAHPSLSTGLLCALVLMGALARMFCEEQFLLVRYSEYEGYAARTARMVPGVF